MRMQRSDPIRTRPMPISVATHSYPASCGHWLPKCGLAGVYIHRLAFRYYPLVGSQVAQDDPGVRPYLRKRNREIPLVGRIPFWRLGEAFRTEG